MRVAELAAALDVSVDTVRYYQKIGLVHPPARRGRVAVYDDSHAQRLREIRRLSEAGFTLAQIQRLSDGHDDPMLNALGGRPSETLTYGELVRQSGLDPELVKLAADTGLVRPLRAASSSTGAGGEADAAGEIGDAAGAGDGPTASEATASAGQQLYSTGSLTMLRAAAELLEAGMPLDDLIGLALRHATNMEMVAADAVELFADRFADLPVNQRADLATRLIPLVTDLVAQHFRASLVERATERIGAGRGGVVAERRSSHAVDAVVLDCRKLADAVDPLAVFAAAEMADVQQRVYWSAPDDDLEFCALGSALDATASAASSGGRFASVAATLDTLDVELTGDDGHPTGPLLVGGFSFGEAEPADADVWHAFGIGRLTLPQVLLLRHQNRTWLTVAAGAASNSGDERDTSTLLDHAVVIDADARSNSAARDTSALLDHAVVTDDSTAGNDHNAAVLAALGERYRIDDRYVSLVESALARIGTSGLDKVVTARELHLSTPLEPVAVLAKLRQRYPSCVTFAFARGSQTFFGATPERLVRSDGTRLWTDALAGSRPRHDNPARDRELAAELQRDPKELTEHAMVVTDVRDTLRACGVTLDAPSPTGVMRLRRIMHLHTPITGRIPAGTSVLDLAGALHPTAAVAGLPRRAACDWIDRHENFDRGWYAAPIGWTTPDGRGEFRVALRCALTGPAGATLFAGGGIVAGADPSAELAETATKLEALLFTLADDQHTDDQHSNDTRSDDQHSNDAHNDDARSDDQHSDDAHTDDALGHDQHADDMLSHDPHSNDAHNDDAHND